MTETKCNQTNNTYMSVLEGLISLLNCRGV